MVVTLDSFINLGILVLFGIGATVLSYAISYFGKYIGEPEEDELSRRKNAVGTGISTFISLCVYWYGTPGLLMLSWSNIVFMLFIVGANTGAIQLLSKVYEKYGIGQTTESRIEKIKKTRASIERIIDKKRKEIISLDEEKNKLMQMLAKEKEELARLTQPEPDPIVETPPQE
ncbi:MAG: hypothetical protein DRI44_06120 [Chlamydiae bacterium]|nr:MAG: hypothetical protein DRI44_06120 [Chlamydiota bacterium]